MRIILSTWRARKPSTGSASEPEQASYETSLGGPSGAPLVCWEVFILACGQMDGSSALPAAPEVMDGILGIWTFHARRRRTEPPPASVSALENGVSPCRLMVLIPSCASSALHAPIARHPKYRAPFTLRLFPFHRARDLTPPLPETRCPEPDPAYHTPPGSDSARGRW